MERCVGPFPPAMVDRTAGHSARKYFDARRRVDWARVLDGDGAQHVKRMPTMAAFVGPDSGTGLLELMRGMLRIDPGERPAAGRLLREAEFFERSRRGGGGEGGAGGGDGGRR